MTSVASLARLPLARVARSPRALAPIAAWLALGVFAALVRARTGAGDVLTGIFARLALPFVAYAVVGATLGGDGLSRAIRPLVAFGAPPARVAAITAATALGISAVLGSALGTVIAAVAHGPGDPALGRDLAVVAWVALLGGAAYAALFLLGASFGKRGGGRAWAFLLDWVLGGGTSAAGVLTPGANVRSLLGGDAVLELHGRWSAALLVALTLLFTSLAIRRAR